MSINFFYRKNISKKDIIKSLKEFKSDVDELVKREYVRIRLGEKFREDLTYIVYENKEISIYNESLLQLKIDLGYTKSFFISRPPDYVILV